MKRQVVPRRKSRVLWGACASVALLVPATALTTPGQAAQQEQPQQEQGEEQKQSQEQEAEQSKKQAKSQDSNSKAQAESSQANAHSGEFVSAAQGEITMTADGKAKHSHKVTENTKVTINGEPARLEDLQKGDTIRVRTGEANTAVAIKAQRGQEQLQRRARKQRPEPREGARSGRGGQAKQGVSLGVQLGPSPTTGVLVRAVRPGSPAQKAGLQRGDYILSVDGQTIASTEELDQALAQKQPGSQADMMIWRNRRKQPMSVSFTGEGAAREGDPRQPLDRPQARRQPTRRQPGARPQARRQQTPGQLRPQREEREEGQIRRAFRPDNTPWLGVFLRETDDRRGVRIERIYPSGPAARAGLRPGDILLSVDGNEVTSPEEATEAIAEFEPGEDAEFVILRGGQERTMAARLAARGEFFGPRAQQRQFRGDAEQSAQFTEESEERSTGRRMPPHAMMLEQHRRFAEQHQRIERSVRELQDEVRKLREEVKRLRGGPQAQAEEPQREEPRPQRTETDQPRKPERSDRTEQ